MLIQCLCFLVDKKVNVGTGNMRANDALQKLIGEERSPNEWEGVGNEDIIIIDDKQVESTSASVDVENSQTVVNIDIDSEQEQVETATKQEKEVSEEKNENENEKKMKLKMKTKMTMDMKKMWMVTMPAIIARLFL